MVQPCKTRTVVQNFTLRPQLCPFPQQLCSPVDDRAQRQPVMFSGLRLMDLLLACRIQLLLVLTQAGMDPPVTWDDMLTHPRNIRITGLAGCSTRCKTNHSTSHGMSAPQAAHHYSTTSGISALHPSTASTLLISATRGKPAQCSTTPVGTACRLSSQHTAERQGAV